MRVASLNKAQVVDPHLIAAHGDTVWVSMLIAERSDGCVYAAPILFSRARLVSINDFFQIFQEAVDNMQQLLSEPEDEDCKGMFHADPYFDHNTFEFHFPDQPPRIQ